MPMRNPIPLALALALVSTGLQLAALFPEHTPQYWQLLVLIGIAGQLLAVIVVTGARRTRRAFAAVVQTDPLTQIGNRRRLQSLLASGHGFLVIFIDLDRFADSTQTVTRWAMRCSPRQPGRWPSCRLGPRAVMAARSLWCCCAKKH